jgi:hypothetical protein
MAQLIFRKRTWFAEFQKMREISMELGNWEAVRQEVLIFPETAKNISMLVEVALDEGDIERALQLLKLKPPRHECAGVPVAHPAFPLERGSWWG